MTVEPLRQADTPEIILSDRQPDAIVDEAIDALLKANDPPTLYMRAGDPVRVLRDEEDRATIREADADAILERLYEAGTWYKRTKKGFTDAEPPRRIAVAAMKRLAAQASRLPPLRGVVQSPLLRRDGTILDTPGYDAATRLVFAPPDGFAMPKVPSEPTLGEREAAVALLEEALAEFPFVDASDRATAWAFLYTVILREVIDGPVPLVIFTAPSQGSGKTLLLDVLVTIATGQRAAVSAMPDVRSDEEMRKLILALLRSGRAVSVLDNVRQPIDSGALSALLTSTRWTGRVLGKSEELELANRSAWAATGNNVSVRGDMARRTIWCRLDPKVARPWLRDGFRHPDLAAWVAERRGELLAAALTLARTWVAAGRLGPSAAPVLGGYSGWRAVVGGVLETAGIEGFLTNLGTIYDEADEETPAWTGFLLAWRERYGDRPVAVAELTKELQSEGAVSELAQAVPPELASALSGKRPGVSIGHALKKQASKRFPAEGEALWIEKAGRDNHAKAVRWRVRSSKAEE